MNRTIMLVVCLMSCSCSAFTMRAPPDQLPPDNRPVHCTSSKGAPVMDTILGGIAAITAVSVGYATTNTPPQRTYTNNNNGQGVTTTIDPSQVDLGIGATVGLTAIAVAYGASAIYGYRQSNDCLDMKEDQAAMQRPTH